MFMKGQDDVKSPLGVSEQYDPEALRCSIPVADLERAVTAAIQKAKPLSILFHGEPGTGKTELAKYLAERAGTRLLVRRASDILSKYVGDSEKHIAAMFEMAAKEGAILLLDEADSFLQERKRSQHMWEVSRVNELLTQMESFSGIFVACTNLTEYLDKAVMRRFSIKVKFDPLDEEGRLRMFERWFPGIEPGEQEKDELNRISRLSPGDFRTVRAMMDSLGRSDPTVAEIIAHLATEAAYRADAYETRDPIGFSS